MNAPRVKTATPADEHALVETVVLAFSDDPMARWCWPSAKTYLGFMGKFVRAFGGGAFAHQSAHCTDDFAGAALWLPPGVGPNEEALGQLIEESVAPSLQPALGSVLEQMGRFHPEGPHWYLPLIGVDPAHQGKGVGAALLSYALRECDRDGLPAYLESSNPRNISLYLRHGFEPIGEIQAGTSPTAVPMLRSPH